MEYGSYQGFKALPENQAEDQMYCLIIKEKETVKLRIGVSAAITLNAGVSGVDEYNVYDWLWNQGLNFLDVYKNDYETLLENYKTQDVTVLIDEDSIAEGELTVPWETLIVKNTDENIT